jgi:molybdate transport system regulatory protein
MIKKILSLNALGQESADKRIDILRQIGVTGSISEAARQTGISYKAAWQAIHTLTNLAGVELVDRAVGGSGGGGARLTAAAEQLLDAAAQMERARQEVLARFSGGAAQAVAGAGLRTSMRNNLRCTVQSLEGLESGEPTVRVVLHLPDGSPVASSITRESAELLDLRPGVAVLVLCKATAVTVSANPEAQAELDPLRAATNRLVAKVDRITRGVHSDEAVLTLAGGQQLVGFAARPNRLRTGSRVLAAMAENAVVLARV